jgi:hypothetical protein
MYVLLSVITGCCAVVALVFLIAQGAAAGAEKVKNPAQKGTAAGKADGKTAVVQKAKGEEVEITVKAPQAYYIMPRSNLNIEGLELNESFIPKIIKSVEETPF